MVVKMYVVLVYDISLEDKGTKRWRSVFKICKKYLSHIQNSVFEGEISKVQLTKLQNELKPHIDKKLDSVVVFKSRQVFIEDFQCNTFPVNFR